MTYLQWLYHHWRGLYDTRWIAHHSRLQSPRILSYPGSVWWQDNYHWRRLLTAPANQETLKETLPYRFWDRFCWLQILQSCKELLSQVEHESFTKRHRPLERLCWVSSPMQRTYGWHDYTKTWTHRDSLVL